MKQYKPQHDKILIGTMVNHYKETAIWADDFEPDDKAAEQDIINFLIATDGLLDFNTFDCGQVAHDFYLTRRRHGAGFWETLDRPYGKELGERLTEIAESFGDTIDGEYLEDGDFDNA